MSKDTTNKAIIINAIILRLNEALRAKNKKLCEGNLHSDQTPLHGFDMFLKLAFLPEPKLFEIAKAAGI